ncbi:alpha/beta hydrolase [Arthrobacter koreensis]|uniref:alpha/beta fold hydrolase n=1 Tax=Arthrobacter koreensis TaxID=199136 RepID=UPI002DB76FB1|nr:alpha/beta hydrolase [Arthrobacter koreensis]MEB7505500.1 alpha/beta hydrolase [Arthrobacter koreensis]
MSVLSEAESEQPVLTSAGGVTVETLVRGDGEPIVLLPSLGRGAGDFDEVCLRLNRAGFQTVCPQPRGFGRSRGPVEDVTMQDLASDVAIALDGLGIRNAIVVGHAFGSQPARMLAQSRPDLVRGLVLAAASAGKVPARLAERPYGRLRAEIDGAGNPALSEEERLRCLQAAFFAPGHDPRQWLGGWNWETHRIQAHAREMTPVDDYFPAGGVPILDLQAEHDAVVIPHLYREHLGERVREEVVPGAGHALLPERPVQCAEAIIRFAGSVPLPETDASPQ